MFTEKCYKVLRLIGSNGSTDFTLYFESACEYPSQINLDANRLKEDNFDEEYICEFCNKKLLTEEERESLTGLIRLGGYSEVPIEIGEIKVHFNGF